MKSIKIKLIAIFTILCLFTCSLTVFAITDETVFDAVLSGNVFGFRCGKYTLYLDICNFTEDEFLGATVEIDYNSDVFEINGVYLDNVIENDKYPIIDGEDGWCVWYNDSVKDGNGTFTINVLNDSMDIVSLSGDSIKCFVEFSVLNNAPLGETVLKIDTDNSLVGTFSESLIESKYGQGSEISVEIFEDMPIIYTTLLIDIESELVRKKSLINNTEIILGAKEETTVFDFLSYFQNDFENLRVIKDGKTLADTDFISTDAYVELLYEGNVVDSVKIAVMGDVDGNSSIDSTDYLRIKDYFLGNTESILQNCIEAADAEEDGYISTTDYVIIKRYFINK